MSYPKTGQEVYVSLNLSNTMLTGIGKGTITREEVSVDYLKRLFAEHGVIVSAKPEQHRLLEIVNATFDLGLELPEELTGSYAAYNELQLAQGFDLRDYLGQGVSRWTYQVRNYPDRPEDVQLNLYLCEDHPIAGDIIAGGEGGFQGTLRYPGE